MKSLIVAGVIVIVALIFLYPGSSQIKALYIVDATQQVIVTRFGEVKSVHRSSGIYAKMPFIDTVISFDRRILRIDAPPIAMPDKEKQNLVIDSYARYRIIDPVQFRKTLQTENNATSRLGDIVTSALRAEVAQRDRFEIIGSKPIPGETDEGLPLFEGTESRSALLEAVVAGVRLRINANEKTQGLTVPDLGGAVTFNIRLDEEVLDSDNADLDRDPKTGITAADINISSGSDGGKTPGIDVIVTGFDPANNTATFAFQPDETPQGGSSFTVRYFVERNEPFGIDIVDVRIKRADFPDSVTPTIFTRMRAERNRIATKFRSEGDEEDLKIRAGANKQREIILADADKKGNQIRGEGEAEAIRILAEALEEDPEFFAFRRSLEAYRKFLSQQTTVILSSEADIFKFLQGPGKGVETVP